MWHSCYKSHKPNASLISLQYTLHVLRDTAFQNKGLHTRYEHQLWSVAFFLVKSIVSRTVYLQLCLGYRYCILQVCKLLWMTLVQIAKESSILKYLDRA